MADLLKKHWRFELVILIGVVLGVSVLWMENLANNQTETRSCHGYGGRLMPDVRIVLGQMENDVIHARNLLQAQPNRLSFVGAQGKIRTYRFAHETVWQDDEPLVSNVRSFHFEFRDQWGNLMTQYENDSAGIETIGYTICVVHNGNEVMAGGKMILRAIAEGGNGHPMASAAKP